jgi:hypothetical protein
MKVAQYEVLGSKPKRRSSLTGRSICLLAPWRRLPKFDGVASKKPVKRLSKSTFDGNTSIVPPGRARLLLHDPPLKWWATFIASLRDGPL